MYVFVEIYSLFSVFVVHGNAAGAVLVFAESLSVVMCQVITTHVNILTVAPSLPNSLRSCAQFFARKPLKQFRLDFHLSRVGSQESHIIAQKNN